MSHSSAAAKPKLLLSTASNRAVTKTSAGPDADKQSKETANKRVAATRAVPSTTRTTTTRKVETKVSVTTFIELSRFKLSFHRHRAAELP